MINHAASFYIFTMKKQYGLIIILFFSLFCSGQERFFGLYPGWVINFSYENTSELSFYGLDTLNFGYSNTPINFNTTIDGTLEESNIYASDTLEGFSVYSSDSYVVYNDYIMACGVYKELLKDYTLRPILMYFDNENYYLDSIIDMQDLFDNRFTIIRFMHVDDMIVDFFGETDFAGGQRAGTYFCKYNLLSGESNITTYSKLSSCKMIPYSAIHTPDGGYIIACEQDLTYALPQKVYGCILKVDSEGNEQWRHVIRGNMLPDAIFEPTTSRPRVFNAPDGNYWVVWTDPQMTTYNYLQSNPNSSIRIAKLTDYNDSCTLTGERSLLSEFDNPELNWWLLSDSYQAENGDIYLLIKNFWGINSSLAKIHSNGVGAWFRTYKCYPDDDAESSYTDLLGLTRTDDGGFMLTGAFRSTSSTMFPDGIQASVVFKVDSCGCFEAEGCNDHCMDSYSEHYVYMQEASVYPNPARDKINVSFDYSGAKTDFTYKIYSLSGQMLQGGTLRLSKCHISVKDLPSGYYTIQLWGGGKIYTGKFVKE